MAVTTKRGTPASEPAQVEMVLAQIEALPTLPTVATRLLELTADETSSARQLVEIIESDQSLSGRILSASRRAHLGTSPASVRQAVVLLGFESIRSMVLSIQIFETFAHRVERVEGHFDRTGFWKHSLAVACAAGALAEAIPGSPKGPRGSKAPVKPEEAFTCGLLHDIGKVVFDACFPKSYDRVVSAAEASRGSITDIERNIFGLDHTIAGQRLAVHWKLPEMIRECAWLHHHTSASTPTRITHADAVAVVEIPLTFLW